jgi:aminomethyltransferase
MSATETLRKTPLHALHTELGGRMVPFHGWELPVQFSSILNEHRAVRGACGLFDVSHMGQVFVKGPGALALLQKINSNDVSRLKDGRALYSHMLNETGGVVDDVIVSRLAENDYLVVVNAATREGDVAWMKRHAEGFDAEIDDRSESLGMIALQGPEAEKVMTAISDEAAGLKRFGAMALSLFGRRAFITRTGYTGEDGFEIICARELVTRAWQTLQARGGSFGLLPCGLGARDTLRLEAGYLLYGSDIDAEHTPYEAGYGWVVKLKKDGFIGKEALEKQKAEGIRRRLTPIKLVDRGVPRPGAEVSFEGRPVGKLASATFSPTLQAGIGVGYLDRPELEPGTRVEVSLHGRAFAAEVVEGPFYKRS